MEQQSLSASPALLFIPDISGFTQFVNETEISHSKHIIEELLETIIDANSLDLKVSEIEGDAILFYKMAEKTEPAAIAKQAKEMFIAFHRHLKLYEHRRICQCGACTTAVNLTLKIVAHQGAVSLSKIHQHEKLFGQDVILVHRLLKNDVPDHEYLLATESIPIHTYNEFDWLQCKEQSATYDAGKVNYRYVSLNPLRNEVPDPPKPDVKLFRTAHPLTHEVTINAPFDTVYQKLIELPYRLQFMDGIKEVKVEDERHNRMNKIGTRHQCIADKNTNDLITSDVVFAEGKIQFSETGATMPVTCDFITERQGEKTKLSMHFHAKLKFPLSLMFNLFMKKKVMSSLQASMENFKKLCEERTV